MSDNKWTTKSTPKLGIEEMQTFIAAAFEKSRELSKDSGCDPALGYFGHRLQTCFIYGLLKANIEGVDPEKGYYKDFTRMAMSFDNIPRSVRDLVGCKEACIKALHTNSSDADRIADACFEAGVEAVTESLKSKYRQ